MSRNSSYSTSQIQVALKFLPGGGWELGNAPIMNYDWNAGEWTVPLNVNVSKTAAFRNMPVKLEHEVNNYIEQPDLFGPEWLIGFNITPVVPNVIENWIQGKQIDFMAMQSRQMGVGTVAGLLRHRPGRQKQDQR